MFNYIRIHRWINKYKWYDFIEYKVGTNSLYSGILAFEWFKITSKPNGLVNILDSALGFYDTLIFYETQIRITKMGRKQQQKDFWTQFQFVLISFMFFLGRKHHLYHLESVLGALVLFGNRFFFPFLYNFI